MGKTLEQIFDTYIHKRDIQVFRNIAFDIKRFGYTLEAALDFVDKFLEQDKTIDIVMKKPCPECGFPMNIYQVNNTPRNQVGGNWKSQWWCMYCWHDELSVLSVTDEVAKAVNEKKERPILDSKKARKRARRLSEGK